MLATTKHHVRIYWATLSLSFKLALTYRFNVLVRSLYAIAYYVLILATMAVVIGQIENLGGWSKPELWLLFAVTSTLNAAMFVMHMHSFRFIMSEGIRWGKIDQYLTKPANTHFLLTTSRPHPDELLYVLTATSVLLWVGWQLKAVILGWNLVSFLLLLPFVWGVLYYWLSIMSATAFFVTQTDQIIEIYDKSTDLAQYPTTIFPAGIRLGLFTLMPIAFLGFVPTSFLLGKAQWELAAATLGVFFLFRWLNTLIWSAGLKRYGSVSS